MSGSVQRQRRSPCRQQGGQVLVLCALSLTAILGFVSLGVDVGVARVAEAKLQTVADAAALAGAAELPYGDVAAGAATAAGLNNFTTGSGGATLTVNNPPASGPYAGDSRYVEAIATLSQPTGFMKLFGIAALAPKARAVAALHSGPGCAYALDSSNPDAFEVNGSFSVNLECAVYVDSSNSQAFYANGSGTLTAQSIGVVGGSAISANVNPAPVDGIAPVSDPLAYLTPPSTSGSCISPTVVSGTGSVTLSPGVYCNRLIINGNPSVTFNPGVYVLDKGMSMSGTPTLTGSGVTFYNDSGSLTLNGTSGSNLSAPTSGPYAGVLVFQSRTNTSQVTLSGSTQAQFNGAIYAAAANILDSGSGATSAYSIFVADTITIDGSTALNDDYSSLTNGSPIQAAVLVE